MKIIIIGCGAIGSTCLSQIESQGHDVVIIEGHNHREEAKANLKDLVREHQDMLLTSIYELGECLISTKGERTTHADVLLLISLEGRKVFGLYGKVSPRRGAVYTYVKRAGNAESR